MLLSRIDRLKWSGLAIDKVVGVTPQGWFSRQQIAGFAQAVGIAPLGGALDAAIVERQNTGGWVVAHELAHSSAGPRSRRARQPPRRRARARLLGRPSGATSPRRRSTSCTSTPPAPTCASPTGPLDLQGDVGLPDDEALDRARSPGRRRRGRHAVAHRHGRPTAASTAGPACEVPGEPDAGEGDGPLTFEQLDADGARRCRRARSAPANELGPIGKATPTRRRALVDRGRRVLAAGPGARRRAHAAHPPRRRRAARRATRSAAAPVRQRRRRRRAVELGDDLKVTWDGDRRRRRHADVTRLDLDRRRRRRGARSATRRPATSLTVKAIVSTRRRRRARAGHDHRRLEHDDRGVGRVRDRRPALRRPGRRQRLAQRRDLDRRPRRQRPEEDRRPRPPPALVARRPQARAGDDTRPLHGQRRRQRRPPGHRRAGGEQLPGRRSGRPTATRCSPSTTALGTHDAQRA